MPHSTRDPDKTRHDLLEAAFWEMYEVGYQAASLDQILRKAGVTKGALYHHFRNKTQLGYAVVDEVIAPWIREMWVEPLLHGRGDAIDTIRDVVQAMMVRGEEEGLFAKGCPLNNLAQEMSPLDEGFRTRLETVFSRWTGAIAEVLRRGQQTGTVRPDIDPDHTGQFIVAALEGVTGLVKNQPTLEFAQGHLQAFYLFLNSLRVPATQVA